MDRAEFQRYIDNALQEAERVRTYCTQDEIVLIMTADFYRELLATADIHANRDGDYYGFLYGYRIAIINEPTDARWSRLRFLDDLSSGHGVG